MDATDCFRVAGGEESSPAAFDGAGEGLGGERGGGECDEDGIEYEEEGEGYGGWVGRKVTMESRARDLLARRAGCGVQGGIVEDGEGDSKKLAEGNDW